MINEFCMIETSYLVLLIVKSTPTKVAVVPAPVNSMRITSFTSTDWIKAQLPFDPSLSGTGLLDVPSPKVNVSLLNKVEFL